MGDTAPSCDSLRGAPGLVHLGSLDPRPVYGRGQGYQRRCCRALIGSGGPSARAHTAWLSSGTRARDRRREPWRGLGCEPATRGCGHTSGSGDGTAAQAPSGAPRWRDPMRVDDRVPPCAGTTHEPVVGRTAGTMRPAAGPVAARRDEPDTGAPRCPWPSRPRRGPPRCPARPRPPAAGPPGPAAGRGCLAWTRRAPDSKAATCDWLTPASAASSRWLRSASRRARARYRPGSKGSRAAPRPPLRSITPRLLRSITPLPRPPQSTLVEAASPMPPYPSRGPHDPQPTACTRPPTAGRGAVVPAGLAHWVSAPTASLIATGDQ